MSVAKHSLDMKDIDKLEHQNNISVDVCGCEDKKIFPLFITTVGITTHCVNLLYITAGETSHFVLLKDLSIPISRWNNNHNNKKTFLIIQFAWLNQWRGIEKKNKKKTTWKEASYTGHKGSSSQKMTTRRSATKSSLHKQNTNYVNFLSSIQISKVFYVNKTPVGHCHQNPSSPNTSITYHVGAASMWNAVIGITLNYSK